MPERPVRAELSVVALQGIPEIGEQDDVAQLLLDSVALGSVSLGSVSLGSARPLVDGDILVVSSKVISKAAGLTRPARQRDDAVAEQSLRVVSERRTARGLAQVVQSVAGPVMAAAGVDSSNAPRDTVLLLPSDPDAAARDLRARLRSLGAPCVAVVITDTAGRPWRAGLTDFALGCAGLVVSEDLRGTPDAGGTPLTVTERAIADEVAAAADLVKGKATGVPAAVVRGLGAFVMQDDGPGASSLLRDPASDWFRLGHVEAVRAALGVPAGAVEAPSVEPEPLPHKAQRALEIAFFELADTLGSTLRRDGDDVLLTLTAVDDFTAGMLTARLLAALWAEDLLAAPHHDPATGRTQIRISEPPGIVGG